MAAMNLLLLTDSYLPHKGGSRVYYHNLYSRLVEQFPDRVTILTKKVPRWEEFDAAECGPRLRIIRRGAPLRTLKYHQLPRIGFPLWDAARLTRRERIDVVHAGDLYPQAAVALALKQLAGVPYVAYCHGEQITQTEGRRFQPQLVHAVYRRANAVVANSDFTRRKLLGIGVEDEAIHIITPGVDYERFNPRPPDPEFIRRYSLEGATVLLTVARLIPRKGHSFVLQAIQRLKAQYPRLRYLIVGVGPEEQRLRAMASELGIAGMVAFAGAATEEELPSFLNACDLFVMPNYDGPDGDIEGFGMVFLEANSAGKPVIGGRSGGTADAIANERTGFLVDAGPEHVCAALERLLANPALRVEMGRRGLARARAEFNWPARARKLRQISAQVATDAANRSFSEVSEPNQR